MPKLYENNLGVTRVLRFTDNVPTFQWQMSQLV
jgi:hypothetical protein